MKCFVIDATAQTISEADYDGDYRTIYKLGGFDCFDAARFNDRGDAVLIDDDGLLKDPERFFSIEGYPELLAGNGVVLGSDDDGKSTSPTVTLDWLKQNVNFVYCPNIEGAIVKVTDVRPGVTLAAIEAETAAAVNAAIFNLSNDGTCKVQFVGPRYHEADKRWVAVGKIERPVS